MNFKKHIVFSVLVIAVISVFSLQNRKTGVFNQSSLATGSYCLAIRGNGELEPAHWGGVSRVVEKLGLPSAMAGGSSGSISMFLINAVAQNPFLQNDSVDQQEKNRRASLLIKSFLGFFTELKNTKFSQDFFKLYGEYSQAKAQGATQEMLLLLAKKNYAKISEVLNQAVELGLFDHSSLYPLYGAIARHDQKSTDFYLKQLSDTITLFGKFDANSDANLFFRPGVINFKNAAESFGRWGAFYAAANAKEEVMNHWTEFFKQCTPDSENRSWAQIVTTKPVCQTLFHQVFTAHFDNEPAARFDEREIGTPIAVYPSTAVLVGNAAGEVLNAFKAYGESLDPQFGFKFKLTNPEEVRFGYWGAPAQLAIIDRALDKTNEKNRRFFALGKTTWKEVLSLSPAEPGLSPLLPFEVKKQTLISAGGWADLHPVDVLKASGCDSVVYLTRQGGESLFAQGVANRLMNLQHDFSTTTADTNAKGDSSADPSSIWSKLFNLANPESSFNSALKKSAAVMCTNWNAFDVKKDLVALIDDAYQSSFYVTTNELKLAPLSAEAKPGCQPMP